MPWYRKEKVPVTLQVYVNDKLTKTVVSTRLLYHDRNGFANISWDQKLKRAEKDSDGNWFVRLHLREIPITLLNAKAVL